MFDLSLFNRVFEGLVFCKMLLFYKSTGHNIKSIDSWGDRGTTICPGTVAHDVHVDMWHIISPKFSCRPDKSHYTFNDFEFPSKTFSATTPQKLLRKLYCDKELKMLTEPHSSTHPWNVPLKWCSMEASSGIRLGSWLIRHSHTSSVLYTCGI